MTEIVLEKQERPDAHAAREGTILTLLSQLGGEAFREEDILFEGDKLVVPVGMTLQRLMTFIERRIDEDEEVTTFEREYRYRPWDGAYCTYRALQKAFGAVNHPTSTIQTFFGPKKVPPLILTVNSGPGETTQVPWGDFRIPYLDNVEFSLRDSDDPEFGPLFKIYATGPKKHKHHVEGVFKLVADELERESLYRGKAFDGKVAPEFIDVDKVDPAKVVYSRKVRAQIEANILSPVLYTKQHRELDIPRKRAVLIHGPFGTGKTLAGMTTAKVAVAHNWTFIYARPGRDDLDFVMKTARLYQPCVVFYEDVDNISDPEKNDGDEVTRLLDTFDGIHAKGTEILIVLTTNNPELIHKGMMRPGRLDAVIEIADLDAEGVQALLRTVVPAEMLDPDTDWAQVAEAFVSREMLPAFISEAGGRTLRYALARTEGEWEGTKIGTADFVNAAEGLQDQLDLMNGAKEVGTLNPVEQNLREIVGEAADPIIRLALTEAGLAVGNHR